MIWQRTRAELEVQLKRYEWLMDFVVHCQPGAIPMDRQEEFIAEVSTTAHRLENGLYVTEEPTEQINVDAPKQKTDSVLLRDFYEPYYGDLRLHVCEYDDGRRLVEFVRAAAVVR